MYFTKCLIYLSKLDRGSRGLRKLEIDLKMLQTHSKPSLPHPLEDQNVTKNPKNLHPERVSHWVRDGLEWISSPEGMREGWFRVDLDHFYIDFELFEHPTTSPDIIDQISKEKQNHDFSWFFEFFNEKGSFFSPILMILVQIWSSERKNDVSRSSDGVVRSSGTFYE